MSRYLSPVFGVALFLFGFLLLANAHGAQAVDLQELVQDGQTAPSLGAGANTWHESSSTAGGVSDSIRLAYQSKRPSFEFGDQASPPAPDYSDPYTWAALPGKEDGADLFPGNTKYPEAQATAPADVFFVHPTGYDSPQHWNSPWDDAKAAEETMGMMIYQASAFNAAARVYAPEYRQFTLYTILEPGPSSLKAVELAYSDVERAFDYFLENYNQGRPFILASHSQGSMHALRLFRKKSSAPPWPSAWWPPIR